MVIKFIDSKKPMFLNKHHINSQFLENHFGYDICLINDARTGNKNLYVAYDKTGMVRNGYKYESLIEDMKKRANKIQ
jgi:hypothetical protein